MLFGHYFESRRNARKDYEQALAEFREDLAIMVEQLEEEQGREVVGRQAEHPAELRGGRGGRQRVQPAVDPAPG